MSPAEPTVTATNDGRSAQVIQIDSGKHVQIVVMCAILCTISAIGTIFAWKVAYDASTEARLLEYYVNGLHGTLVANGISQAGDDYSLWKEKRERGGAK